VNFCARSVVTCDSYIDADEILVPRGVASRLTYPVVVHAYNLEQLTTRLHAGTVLFVQRAGQPRLRAIGHIAILACELEARDCIVRRNRKYPLLRPPLPTVDDIPLPIQCHVDGTETALCFGDRVLRYVTRTLLDPLHHVTWPVLEPGDTVLVTPQDGDWCLMNRQPTLVTGLFFFWKGASRR
jgi:DNA-directed RNA polymerase beta' subunit